MKDIGVTYFEIYSSYTKCSILESGNVLEILLTVVQLRYHQEKLLDLHPLESVFILICVLNCKIR